MKHLKTYKLFETSDKDILLDARDILLDLSDSGIETDLNESVDLSSIKNDLQDIFLELEDDGYHIVINRLLRIVDGKTDKQIGFTMDIYNYKNFNILDVLDPLEHSIEYMKDNGYSYSIDAKFKWTYDKNNIQIEDIRKNNHKIIKVRVTFKSNQ